MAPKQAVEPLIASKATDGLGQMELPIAETMRDADPVMEEARDAGVGRGSVASQARRLDFWSTSRDSGPTATVSYRRRRSYAAPDAATEDAATEDVAPEASREAAASEVLTESDAPEAPMEAMPSAATTEAVADAPVEVLATDEPTEAAAQDELTETAAPLRLKRRGPRSVVGNRKRSLKLPLRKRRRKRRGPRSAVGNRKRSPTAAPEAAPEEKRTPQRGRKPKTLTETATPEAAPEERRAPMRGRKPEIPQLKLPLRKSRLKRPQPGSAGRSREHCLAWRLPRKRRLRDANPEAATGAKSAYRHPRPSQSSLLGALVFVTGTAADANSRRRVPRCRASPCHAAGRRAAAGRVRGAARNG